MRGNRIESKWLQYAENLRPRLQLVLILLACMLAVACSTRGMPRTEGVPPEVLALLQPLPAFDPSLLQPGPESLPDAKSDDVPTLLRNHDQGAAIYHDVRESHVGLIKQAKKREAIEADRLEAARKAIERNP